MVGAGRRTSPVPRRSGWEPRPPGPGWPPEALRLPLDEVRRRCRGFPRPPQAPSDPREPGRRGARAPLRGGRGGPGGADPSARHHAVPPGRRRLPRREGPPRRSTGPCSTPPCGRPRRRSACPVRRWRSWPSSTRSPRSPPGSWSPRSSGVLAGRPELRPDPREVERIFDVALADLLAEGVHRVEHWGTGVLTRAVHFFELDGRDGVGPDRPDPVRFPHVPHGPDRVAGRTTKAGSCRTRRLSWPLLGVGNKGSGAHGSRDRHRQVGATGLRVRRHRHRPQPADPRPGGRRHLLGARRLPLRAAAAGVGHGRGRLPGHGHRDRAPRRPRRPQPRRACGPATRTPTRSSRRSPSSRPRRRRCGCSRSTPSPSRTS